MFAISPTRSMARPSSAGRTSMRAMSGCRLPERSRERFVDEVYGRIVRLLSAGSDMAPKRAQSVACQSALVSD